MASTCFLLGSATHFYDMRVYIARPYRIDGVPTRRVDIYRVDVEKFEDKYFSKKSDKKKNRKDAKRIFRSLRNSGHVHINMNIGFWEKQKFPQEKKDDQKTVDVALIKLIESVPNLKAYLGARFSLKDGMKPHELVF
ncbi:hypothetical protein Dimus_012825 [Dionaea muscipula]